MSVTNCKGASQAGNCKVPDLFTTRFQCESSLLFLKMVVARANHKVGYCSQAGSGGQRILPVSNTFNFKAKCKSDNFFKPASRTMPGLPITLCL